MDHTLLTAVHPRTIAPLKMNAKQEQDYYDRGAVSLALPEKLFSIMNEIRRLAATLLALTHVTGKVLGHGLTTRKAVY
ncbi:MAG: hypothetical protein WCC66_16560 [Rhizobiaceae bacterium]